MSYDEDDDLDDPILARRRQLRERSRKRLMLGLALGGAVLGLVSFVTIVAVSKKRSGSSTTEPRDESPRKTVEGRVDIISMDMGDFIEAIGQRPNEDKAVIVLKRRNQPDAYCYFPPKSGGEAWLLSVNLGDEMLITGRLQSESQHLVILVDCKMVSHTRR